VRTLVGLLAALIALTGCSGSTDDSAPTPSTVTPLPAPDRDTAPVPDRDVDAVSASLAMLDPCALLVAAGARDPQSHGINQCQAGPLEVQLNRSLDASIRYRLLREEVAGHVVYLAPGADCHAWLPVTQARAIRIGGSASCDRVRRAAETLVDIVANRPRSVVRPPSRNRQPTCAPWRLAYPRAEISPVSNDVVGDQCHAELDGRSLGIVEFPTWHVSQSDDQSFHLDGVEIFANDVSTGCWYEWPAWASDLPTDDGEPILAHLRREAPCSADDPVLARMVTAVRESRAVDAPVEGLLYPWGSDDTAATGACRDTDAPECLPAATVEAPSDPADLIAMGEVRPDVLCAAAAPLVEEHFGPGFAAVTATDNLSGSDEGSHDRRCLFVEERHGLEIEVRTDTEPLGAGDSEVAGHPAITTVDSATSIQATRAWAVAWQDVDEPGSLHISVRAQLARGDSTDRDPRADVSRLDPAEAFATAMVTTLLG